MVPTGKVGTIPMHIISLPISVPVTKKKRFYLNLNQYRNAHHFTLSRAKINFHEIVAPLLKDLPRFKTVDLVFTLFPGSEQLVDTSNVCSIVDKFFSDVLVSCKKIEDDNRKIVLSATYRYGEVDRTNPRCEVTISPGDVSPDSVPTHRKEASMQITIVQTEIEEAIRNRILDQISVREGMRIDIDLKATRGPEGYQAVINIVPGNSPATARNTDDETPPVRVSKSSSASGGSSPTVVKSRPSSVTKAEAKAEQAEQLEPESETATDSSPSSDASTDTGTSEGDAQASTESTAGVEGDNAASAPRKSLFGDMRAPVNA
jgi:hypothetical protein